MNIIKQVFLMSVVVFITCLFFGYQVSAESIEETVKYKAPTMDQTIEFIDKMTMHNFTFNPGQCLVSTKKAINTKIYIYEIPLKKINPSPEYVKPHLNCVTLTADGNEKVIKRIESNGEVEWKSRTDICTPDRESAENLAKAIRYLISICGGPPCDDCDPFQWQ